MSNAKRVENYYEVLGVVFDANDDLVAQQAKIKKAFRALSLKYHPDRLETKPASEKAAAEAQFKKINDAYETLSDPTKREAYDIRMGFKVVVADAPFNPSAWDQWVNDCIATGHVSSLHDFILDATQPQNIRRHISIHLFNYYYVSERYDAIYALAKNPALSFVKKEALVGLVKGYVKQVRKKGASIPFSTDSSTVSSRWSAIGNPFDQFDRDSIDAASREAVAYLFTARRSTHAAKMVDYDALHTIATNPAFPDSMRTLAAVGDESDRTGTFPGLVRIYSRSSSADRLIDLARSANLDYSSKKAAGIAAVDLMHEYAVSVSSTEPLYYLNILGAVAYSDASDSRVVEEVRFAGVSKSIEVARTCLIRTSATIHIDRVAEFAKNPLVDEKSRSELARFIGEASTGIQYTRPVRQYFASAAIAIYRSDEDWSSLSDLAKSSSLDVTTRKKAVIAILDLSRSSKRSVIREHALNAAIDCFASLNDTQTLYDIATNPHANTDISQKAFVALVSLYKDPANVHLIDELLTNPKFEKFVPAALDDVLRYYVDANHYDGVMTLAIRDYPQEKRTAAAKTYLDAAYRDVRYTSYDLWTYASLEQFTLDARTYAATRAMDKIDAVAQVATASSDISSDLSVAREIFSTAKDDSLKTRARKQYSKLLQKTTDAALLLGVAKDPLFEESDRVDCTKTAVALLRTSDDGIAVLLTVATENGLPRAAKAAVLEAIPSEFKGEDYYRSVLEDTDSSASDKSNALKSLVAIYEKSENTGALLAFAVSDSYGEKTRKYCAKKVIEIHVRRRNYLDLDSLEKNPAIPIESNDAAHDALIQLVSGETNPSAIPATFYSNPTSSMASLVVERCKCIAADLGFAVGARDNAASIVIGVFAKLADPSSQLLEFSKTPDLSNAALGAVAQALCGLDPSHLDAVVASKDYPLILRSRVGAYLVSTLDSSRLYSLYGSGEVPLETRVAAGLKIVDSNEGSFDKLSPLAASSISQIKGAATGAIVRLINSNAVGEIELGSTATNPNFDLDLRIRAGYALVDKLSPDTQKTYLLVVNDSLPSEVRSAAANSCINGVIASAKANSDYDRLVAVAQNPICSANQKDDAVSAFVEVALFSNSPPMLAQASARFSGSAKTKVDEAISLLSFKADGRVDDLILFASDASKTEDLRSFAVGIACDIYCANGSVDLLLLMMDDRSLPSSSVSRIASSIVSAQENIDLRLTELVQGGRILTLAVLAVDDTLSAESRSKAASAFLKTAPHEGEFRSIVDLARSGALDASLSAQVESALLFSLDKSPEHSALVLGNIDGMVKLLEISDVPDSVRSEIGRRIVDSLSNKKDRNKLNDLLDQPQSKVPDSVRSMATKALSNLDVSEVAAKAAPKVTAKDLVAGVVVVRKKL